MTRATLLQVLDQPTALGPAEVRELEQLAQAFPYCQTAHLLLAKAAHDQGTMLAGQRLRRAATYAADRALLRQLIEQVEPTATPLVIPLPPIFEQVPAATPETPAVAGPASAALLVDRPDAQLAPAATVPDASHETKAPGTGSTVSPAVELPAPPPEPEPAPTASELALPDFSAATPDAVRADVAADTTAPEPTHPANLAVDLEADLPSSIDLHVVEPTLAVLPPVGLPVDEAEADDELPAQAPAVRPPVEVGEARFEFGLAEVPAVPAPAFELPGLIDEWAASAVTRSLGTLAPLTEPAKAPLAAAAPAWGWTPAAFTGDETVGYGFGESSRLGFSMQLLGTIQDMAADGPATAVAMLPPSGAAFEPDLLLLAHWAAHCPPPPVVPSSLDLINNFLRRQPRLTRPAMLPPSPASQTDLSVRSTRAEPDLASESLARILVRQGKTARAIEIYEKLMVKQPEKMAYFAAQIQQLQPPA